MKRRRYAFLGEHPAPRPPLLLNCGQHGEGVVGWVSCVHVDAIRVARRHPKPLDGVAGEAVCSGCRVLLDSRRVPVESLRFVCEACVLASWPVEGAS